MNAQRNTCSKQIHQAARVSSNTLSIRSHLLSVASAPSTCFSRDRAPAPRLVSLSTPPGNSLHLQIYSCLSQLNGNHSQLYCSLNTAGETPRRRAPIPRAAPRRRICLGRCRPRPPAIRAVYGLRVRAPSFGRSCPRGTVRFVGPSAQPCQRVSSRAPEAAKWAVCPSSVPAALSCGSCRPPAHPVRLTSYSYCTVATVRMVRMANARTRARTVLIVLHGASAWGSVLECDSSRQCHEVALSAGGDQQERFDRPHRLAVR
eukprot:COSAG02_NODE_8224_length_2652_cov_6.520538_3_plen_260_part_00